MIMDPVESRENPLVIDLDVHVQAILQIWQADHAYGRLILVFEDGRIDRFVEERTTKVPRVEKEKIDKPPTKEYASLVRGDGTTEPQTTLP